MDVVALDGEEEHALIAASKVFFKKGNFNSAWGLVAKNAPWFLQPVLVKLSLTFADFRCDH